MSVSSSLGTVPAEQRVRCASTPAMYLVSALVTLMPGLASAKDAATKRPTVVLVHGAFADSSSWDGVITPLLADGYPVVAASIAMRGLRSDADYVAAIVKSIDGPVVLVGHSYGGAVITNAVRDNQNVEALVYVAGFAPVPGESGSQLSARFPGSTLGQTLAPPVALPDGGRELSILQKEYHRQFAGDVAQSLAERMAVTQRPITESALNEPSGSPGWRSLPSWFIFGSLDRNIPAAVHAFMAERAGAKAVVKIDGASHVVMVSHPDAVARVICQAAGSRVDVRSAASETIAEKVFDHAPVVPLVSEPPARLIVEAPLPEQLARGYVVVRYRAENARLMPVYGPSALGVSPRIGHLHVTVDDQPWHWLDASGEPLSINGLPPGPHKLLLELEDPTHRLMDSATITFDVPHRQPAAR